MLVQGSNSVGETVMQTVTLYAAIGSNTYHGTELLKAFAAFAIDSAGRTIRATTMGASGKFEALNERSLRDLALEFLRIHLLFLPLELRLFRRVDIAYSKISRIGRDCEGKYSCGSQEIVARYLTKAFDWREAPTRDSEVKFPVLSALGLPLIRTLARVRTSCNRA
jgi:hypothetical protein